MRAFFDLSLFLQQVFFALAMMHLPLTSACAEAERVKIGVTIPLSGGLVEWGDSIRRGIELYAEQPTNRFVFDFQDEAQGDAKKALGAYRKYRLSDIRYVIVATMAGTKAVLPVAARDPLLFLSIGLVDDEELRQSDKLVSLATQLSTESEFLGKHVVQRGFSRIAILHRVDPFSEEFARTLKSSLEQAGAKVVSQQGTDANEADFRPCLLRVKASGADAFCFNVTQDRQTVLVQQLKELGLPLALFSNYDFENEAALKQEKILKGVEYSFPLNTAEDSKEKADFDLRFKARYGQDAQPGANTYFIYDGLVLLARALSVCDTKDVLCVNRYFKSLKSYDGLSGHVSFRPDGSNVRPYGIKTIHDGRYVWIRR